MRVISGKFRGLVLAEFKGDDIRPTADRVKESLFNIIYSKVSASRVLDLFCGSGNLGIECLSRGAESVHFNDLSRSSIDVLKKNLLKLKGEVNYTCTISDYLTCLKSTRQTYDIIFIDPPYRFDYGVPAMQTIVQNNLLNEGGIIVYERDRAFEGDICGLQLYDERKYGKTYLSFFKSSNED
jgi:16S rRNA (guanine(966)-N(2))-methyltransferase RsmD